MPKPNYAFEKRQRELEKQRKKADKQQRKAVAPGADASDTAQAPAPLPAAEPAPPR